MSDVDQTPWLAGLPEEPEDAVGEAQEQADEDEAAEPEPAAPTVAAPKTKYEPFRW